MTGLLQFSRWIDHINARVGQGVSWLILAMTIISAANAISRKAFSVSSNAFLELQWYLFASVFLLAAGYTLMRDGHVRIDLLSGRLAPRVRLWIELLTTLLFLFPLTILVLRYGWPYFMDSVRNHEVSLNAGGLWVWPVKFLIPLGFVLLFLQGVSQVIKIIAAMQGQYPFDNLFASRHDANVPTKTVQQ